MLIIPAIDLLRGKVVRLKKGDMDDFKVYYNDPLDAASLFCDLGINRIHIVDLDGAKKGDTVNFNVIEKIISRYNIKVEVGGGIRDMNKLDSYFLLGAEYAILGTVVIKNVEFTKEAIAKYPNKIILGIDAKDGYVATDGWYSKSCITALEAADMYKGLPAESIIYTDIERDGMLQGINLDTTLALAKHTSFPVIASGGVKDIGDVKNLYSAGGIYGCIVGKAFYEGSIDLKEAVNCVNQNLEDIYA